MGREGVGDGTSPPALALEILGYTSRSIGLWHRATLVPAEPSSIRMVLEGREGGRNWASASQRNPMSMWPCPREAGELDMVQAHRLLHSSTT